MFLLSFAFATDEIKWDFPSLFSSLFCAFNSLCAAFEHSN